MATQSELELSIAKARVDRTEAVNTVLMAFAQGKPISTVKAAMQAVADADRQAADDMEALLKLL